MAIASVTSYPIQYKGLVINFVIYTDTETGLVKSWDIMHRNFKLNNASNEDLARRGLKEEDILNLNVLAQTHIDAREGRTIGSSGPLY